MIESLNEQLSNIALNDGFTQTKVENVHLFKSSSVQEPSANFYDPFVCLVTQGVKHCYVGDTCFKYQAGDFFINFLPSPVRTQVTKASQQQPFLSAALTIDLSRIADLVLKIDRIDNQVMEKSSTSSSCMITGKASHELIAAFTRLVRVSQNKLDSAILSEACIDEVYYRILTSEYGFVLHHLLNQFGQIQPISKTVSHIHNNIDRTIAIEELASIAHMSKTSFFNAFKQLMHIPPLQYIKSTKLQKAQILLKQGVMASEACYQVGYNSFSQFSREYKRHFGFSPSETLELG